MKKASLQYLVNLMNYRIQQNGGETETDMAFVGVRDELVAELNRAADVKAKNAEAYEAIHELVVSNLGETPCTCSELHDAIASEPGKPNTYRRA